MKRIFRRALEDDQEVVYTDVSGGYILNDPLLNKGTAFTERERESFGLHGHIPYHISTIEEQTARRYSNYSDKKSDMEKFVFLSALQNRNEILYYRLVLEHAEEMLPLIYTPTVGEASLHYSYIYNQDRGVYLSYPHKGRLQEIMNGVHRDEIDVIVITDGSRILGLGDLGIGGMAIPVGKLALYTLFGGIHPAKTLPILLDVGTNTPQLLEDPLYLGWQHPRIEAEEYYAFVDEAIAAITKRFPNALIQWEDFRKPYAATLLQKYKDKICTFNDDIQGTASVALAAVYAGLKKTGKPFTGAYFLIVGGGSAGIGIAEKLKEALILEGKSEKEAAGSILVIDIHGLLRQGDPMLDAHQSMFAQPQDIHPQASSLKEVIKAFKPSVLIGVTAQAGMFDEEVVRSMCEGVERPIILPLSNPSNRVEVLPSDAVAWSKGKAIIATGSPFHNVTYEGKVCHISQCNNVYIFPGVGLGIIAAESKHVPDEVFIIAAKKLASFSEGEEGLFPKIENLREVSKSIAIEVVKYLQENDLSSRKESPEECVEAVQWYPSYPLYKKV